MIDIKTLITGFICLFITACDSQQPTVPVEKPADNSTTAPEPTVQESQPVLDLSIEHIPLELNSNTEQEFLQAGEVEENSELFRKLSEDRKDSKLNIRGKLFTDENKLEEKDYLNAVEGGEITVEGQLE